MCLSIHESDSFYLDTIVVVSIYIIYGIPGLPSCLKFHLYKKYNSINIMVLPQRKFNLELKLFIPFCLQNSILLARDRGVPRRHHKQDVSQQYSSS